MFHKEVIVIKEPIKNINLFILRKKFKILKKQINNYINLNPMELINSIFVLSFNNTELNGNNDVKELLYLIFDDIRKNEKLNFSDIEYLNRGAYMKVFSLGTKVIKIGCQEVKKFPNNPYIVQPLIRKEIIIGDYKFDIEVAEKCLTQSDIQEIELYNIYKKLRDIGLVWVDIKKENIGILLKNNIIHWNKYLNRDDKILGFEGYRGNEILKKGDYVILDAYYIYDEKNYEFTNLGPNSSIQSQFEKKYQIEKHLR